LDLFAEFRLTLTDLDRFAVRWTPEAGAPAGVTDDEVRAALRRFNSQHATLMVVVPDAVADALGEVVDALTASRELVVQMPPSEPFSNRYAVSYMQNIHSIPDAVARLTLAMRDDARRGYEEPFEEVR
jgi:hypothetical protein